MVIGDTLDHAPSSGPSGNSPWIRGARIIIPSELTRGTPKPTKTPAMTRMDRNMRSRRREEVFVFVCTMGLPELNPTNFVFSPLAYVEIPLRVQCEADRGIDDSLHSKKSISMFHGPCRFLRHEPCGAAAPHISVFVAAVPIACHRRDESRRRINFTHPVVHRVRDIEIIMLIDHYSFRSMKHGPGRRFVIPVITIPAHACHCGDNTGTTIDTAYPITALVDKNNIALPIQREPDDIIEASFECRFSIVKIHGHVQPIRTDRHEPALVIAEINADGIP